MIFAYPNNIDGAPAIICSVYAFLLLKEKFKKYLFFLSILLPADGRTSNTVRISENHQGNYKCIENRQFFINIEHFLKICVSYILVNNNSLLLIRK